MYLNIKITKMELGTLSFQWKQNKIRRFSWVLEWGTKWNCDRPIIYILRGRKSKLAQWKWALKGRIKFALLRQAFTSRGKISLQQSPKARSSAPRGALAGVLVNAHGTHEGLQWYGQNMCSHPGGRRKHGARCRVMWIRLKGDYLGQVAKKMEMERNAGVMLLDRFKGG